MLFLHEEALGFFVLILLVIAFCFLVRTAFRFVKWLFRSVWGILSGKRYNTNDPLKSKDWLTRAQARQEIRFDNSLLPLSRKAKPQKKTLAQKWNESKGRSANGWTYNEDTQLWEPPKKLTTEAQQRWKWDDKKQIWIDLDKRK